MAAVSLITMSATTSRSSDSSRSRTWVALGAETTMLEPKTNSARRPSGSPIDARAKLKDGIEFDGVDGLRNYLLTKKRDVFVRLFCKRLLGYALGRSMQLSDTSLLDKMVVELDKTDGKVSAALLPIVRSPQFRMRRGSGMYD